MMQKTYLSRSIDRTLEAEYPVGDPYHGPVYGEKRAPVTAVVGGIAAMAGAETMIGMVLAGMTIAGGALSLVGAVAGNETLAKIGGVIGLVGAGGLAISSLVDAAGTAAGAADINGMEAGNMPTGPTEAAAAPVTTTAPYIAPETPIGIDNLSTPAADVAGLEAGNMPVGNETATGNPNSVFEAMKSGSWGSTQVTAQPNVDPAVLAGEDLAKSYGPNAPAVPTVKGVAPPESPGLIKQALGWMEANPKTAKILADTAGGLASALSPETDAKISALEAQGELSKAQAEKLRWQIAEEERKRANLNASIKQGLPTMGARSGTMQTAAPVLANVRTPGLINGIRGG